MSTVRDLVQDHDDQEDSSREAPEDLAKLLSEVTDSVEAYCRSRPGIVAGMLFGLGFFCGWKLRPW